MGTPLQWHMPGKCHKWSPGVLGRGGTNKRQALMEKFKEQDNEENIQYLGEYLEDHIQGQISPPFIIYSGPNKPSFYNIELPSRSCYKDLGYIITLTSKNAIVVSSCTLAVHLVVEIPSPISYRTLHTISFNYVFMVHIPQHKLFYYFVVYFTILQIFGYFGVSLRLTVALGSYYAGLHCFQQKYTVRKAHQHLSANSYDKEPITHIRRSIIIKLTSGLYKEKYHHQIYFCISCVVLCVIFLNFIYMQVLSRASLFSFLSLCVNKDIHYHSHDLSPLPFLSPMIILEHGAIRSVGSYLKSQKLLIYMHTCHYHILMHHSLPANFNVHGENLRKASGRFIKGLCLLIQLNFYGMTKNQQSMNHTNTVHIAEISKKCISYNLMHQPKGLVLFSKDSNKFAQCVGLQSTIPSNCIHAPSPTTYTVEKSTKSALENHDNYSQASLATCPHPHPLCAQNLLHPQVICPCTGMLTKQGRRFLRRASTNVISCCTMISFVVILGTRWRGQTSYTKRIYRIMGGADSSSQARSTDMMRMDEWVV
ncbi:hypothetical protein VP01_1726g1 [Puccinia sorghi]|uniref:Uncharacterized protein n=1 Tax=Puccinia sorghi TaxID=27349 RepID=A0A0L6VFF6_9BASI|nr:hypothetical protein VP01_1726g1 [Puccinia sorghi]